MLTPKFRGSPCSLYLYFIINYQLSIASRCDCGSIVLNRSYITRKHQPTDTTLCGYVFVVKTNPEVSG